jgi:collagenase-like PrtC family protease
MTSYLTTPCHWNLQILKEILDQKEGKGIMFKEMYGVLPNAPIGHGRSPSVLKSLDEYEIYQFRRKLKENNIDFAYLLNSPFSKKELAENKKETLEYIKWILDKVNPDSLIIASFDVMEIVREISEIPITISTIARIKNVGDIKKYLSIKPSKIVVQHDVNRNFEDLKKIVEFAKFHNIIVEVMLTESCRRRCPLMIKHYQSVGKGKSDKSFHRQCNIKKIESPEELLLANFIRPEDIEMYEKIDINHFKITGRSKKADWLPEVVNAYRQRKFNGNLIRLLGIDPCLSAESWIYISNKSLKGFLENFPREGGARAERDYCKKWIKRLYYGGNFWVTNVEYNGNRKFLVPIGNIEENPQIKKVYFRC